jgi:hypothetical protein
VISLSIGFYDKEYGRCQLEDVNYTEKYGGNIL